MIFVLSDFARLRHVPAKPFSHYQGGVTALLALVSQGFPGREGYRDGVRLVPVPPAGFRSGTVEVTTGAQLEVTFAARRPGEEPYIQVAALGPKLPALAVEVVLYRSDVLALHERSEPDAPRILVGEGEETWEVISINARPTEEPEPMSPLAMARNMLGLPGGTPGTYTAEEFARSVVYWSRHANRSEAGR